MSAEKVKKQISVIRNAMGQSFEYYETTTEVNDDFLRDINALQGKYGEFLGKAKAKHQEYSKEFVRLDNDITTCFVKLSQTSYYKTAFQVLNVAIGKISELISLVETIESAPPEEKVSKTSYNRLLREKEKAESTAKFLVQYSGLPELHTLIENANKIGIEIDEYWVLALCSINLLEAIVNKKLADLSIKLPHNAKFEEKYNRLCKIIKEKEDKDLPQLLPSALYKVRNKLDHASESNRVTPKEAKDISEWVIKFMKEVFQ